jgi:hypothetical protein
MYFELGCWYPNGSKACKRTAYLRVLPGAILLRVIRVVFLVHKYALPPGVSHEINYASLLRLSDRHDAKKKRKEKRKRKKKGKYTICPLSQMRT